MTDLDRLAEMVSSADDMTRMAGESDVILVAPELIAVARALDEADRESAYCGPDWAQRASDANVRLEDARRALEAKLAEVLGGGAGS